GFSRTPDSQHSRWILLTPPSTISGLLPPFRNRCATSTSSSATFSSDGAPDGMPARIAVVIPYFQRTPGVLARTLNAVFAQDVDAAIEVVIADDGSPVPAANELAGLSTANQARTRVIARRNGGPAAARNTGLANVAAENDFIALLDSD